MRLRIGFAHRSRTMDACPIFQTAQLHAAPFADQPLSPGIAVEISVLLVEEHKLRLAALRALVTATPGLAVVAEACEFLAAQQLALLHRPDVVLVDGRMLSRAGSDDLPALRRATPEGCLLILTDDTSERPSGLDEGYGCLSHDKDVSDLCTMVVVLLGARCANCVLGARCPVPQVAATLSRRERQVAVRVADGLTSKQIAVDLGISLHTVHTYRESLARKLGASSAAVITRFVLNAGLTDVTSRRDLSATQ